MSVYKPDGTLLVKDLNFAVQRGSRVLVTGPNGCGECAQCPVSFVRAQL